MSVGSAPSVTVGYWKINDGDVARTIECGDGSLVDVDAAGRIVGVETIGHADFLRAVSAALHSLTVSAPIPAPEGARCGRPWSEHPTVNGESYCERSTCPAPSEGER